MNLLFLSIKPQSKPLVRRFLGCIVFLVFAFYLQAQDFDYYQPLRSQGEVPEELQRSSGEKYKAEKAKLANGGKGKDVEVQDKFLLQSNFMLDEMLLSGNVVFNDAVSEYVNKVKDKLLEGQPELQAKIKAYVVKSPIANAFATNSGILLVNIGLLARLHNEAELAFVLSHEIQHYLKKHPMNVYVKSEELKSNLRVMRSSSADEFVSERSKYSRSVEQEADELGFELYKKSGYSLSAAMGAFDVLALAEHAIDETPWESYFFEWEFLRFPASYSKWPLDSIVAKEDGSDSLSTHPNIAKRRASIQAKVDAEANDDGEVFLVGPMDFLNIRKICRFEISESYLQTQAYSAAFYNSYILLTEEPESHYLQKNMVRSLFGMSKYKSNGRFGNVHRDSENTQGERQQIQFFWENLNAEEFNILALRFAWLAHKNAPKDKEFNKIVSDLILDLHKNSKSTVEWLAKERPTEMPAIVSETQDLKLLAFQKRGKIAEESEKKVEKSGGQPAARETKDIDYMQWALSDLFEEQDFKDAWNAGIELAENPEEKEVFNWRLPYRKLNDLSSAKGLNASKIVFVQPIGKKIDQKKVFEIDYLESENLLSNQKLLLQDICKKMGIASEFLETRSLKSTETTKFNDAVLISEWFSEVLAARQFGNEMVSFRKSDVDSIAKKMGTQYFCWHGVMKMKEKLSPQKKMTAMIVGLILWPTLPIAIYAALRKYRHTYLVTYVLDAERNEVVFQDYRRMKGKRTKNTMKANIFDILNQIRHK